MKKGIFILACFAALSLAPGTASAQDKVRAAITSVKQKNAATVAFTVTSSGDFIMGNNKYVLHIGENTFDLYEQYSNEGTGALTFLIPAADFKALHNGTTMYLTYGDAEGEQTMEALSKDGHYPCWNLGKFNSDLLK
ncbi:MAG: hypothetical protein V4649_07935 [Bacteroidota bacterium]